MEASKRHFPEYAAVWSHPKLRVHVGDAAEFVAKSEKRCYDVVIVDSSDPIGPNESLFNHTFYKHCRRVLRRDGVLCVQSGCIWLNMDVIAEIHGSLSELFPSTRFW